MMEKTESPFLDPILGRLVRDPDGDWVGEAGLKRSCKIVICSTDDLLPATLERARRTVLLVRHDIESLEQMIAEHAEHRAKEFYFHADWIDDILVCDDGEVRLSHEVAYWDQGYSSRVELWLENTSGFWRIARLR